MKSNRKINILFGLIAIFTLQLTQHLSGQNLKNIGGSTPINLGAYYFDGWTGKTQHITDDLKNNFSQREPVFGWVTSTPALIKTQIDLAANAGLSFFSFCWYDKMPYESYPLNNALNLYLKAPNRDRLKFNLLVANHQGFIVGPKDWNLVSNSWIKYFKNPQYLTIDGKPLITFFSYGTLIQEFGSTAAVKQAFDQLRALAVQNGLKGVVIAACVYDGSIGTKLMASQCGFDVLTGYNYHSAGFKDSQKVTPIDSLRTASVRVWNSISRGGIPMIPVVTLNWDPRPWKVINPANGTSAIYNGYSPESVFKQIETVKSWAVSHPNSLTKEKLVVLYAWNEYGEGGYLTPSKNSASDYLSAVKKALTNK